MVGPGIGVMVGVGGRGVAVGVSVAIGGTGVAVGGKSVAVGGTWVAVGGTDVAVGGIGVDVNTVVTVGGGGVLSLDPGPPGIVGTAVGIVVAVSGTWVGVGDGAHATSAKTKSE